MWDRRGLLLLCVEGAFGRNSHEWGFINSQTQYTSKFQMNVGFYDPPKNGFSFDARGVCGPLGGLGGCLQSADILCQLMKDKSVQRHRVR